MNLRPLVGSLPRFQLWTSPLMVLNRSAGVEVVSALVEAVFFGVVVAGALAVVIVLVLVSVSVLVFGATEPFRRPSLSLNQIVHDGLAVTSKICLSLKFFLGSAYPFRL